MSVDAEFEAHHFTPDHLENVWRALSQGLKSSIEQWHIHAPQSNRDHKALLKKAMELVKQGKKDDPIVLRAVKEAEGVVRCRSANEHDLMDDAFADFERNRPVYQKLVSADYLSEFEDDPVALKDDLRTRCPMFRVWIPRDDEAGLMWKSRYQRADSQSFLTALKNIAAFLRESTSSISVRSILSSSEVSSDLDSITYDESYAVENIIGGSLQSALLYYHDPGKFSRRNTEALTAFSMMSGAPEFRFVNKAGASIIRSKYPYKLFHWHACRASEQIMYSFKKNHLPFDESRRYIYLEALIKSMKAQYPEQFNPKASSARYRPKDNFSHEDY